MVHFYKKRIEQSNKRRKLGKGKLINFDFSVSIKLIKKGKKGPSMRNEVVASLEMTLEQKKVIFHSVKDT